MDDLCHACNNFDLRALYALALERSIKTKPRSSFSGGIPRYEGFPFVYEQHSSLRSLLNSANSGCRLCNAIWQQSVKQLPPGISDPTGTPNPDECAEPIHFGLSDWHPEAAGMPYLTAVQRLPRGVMRSLATFELFVDPDDVPSGYGQLLARTVQPDPASEASFKVAKYWHANCLENHPKCARVLLQERPLPTRVIDVGDANTNPKLIAGNGINGTWAALSYCWGGNSHFVLNKETSIDFYGGHIALAEYPQTLQDAIIISRTLNMQYVWIDALCILQDSQDDWAAEAARMKDVYGGASITIAATNSRSTTDGIFKTRKISQPLCSLDWRTPIPSKFHQVHLRSSSDFWDTTLKYEPLNTRGWTLQESFLAQRTLSYGTQQMVWECQCLKTSESGRPVLPDERHRDKAFVQSIISNEFSMWARTKLALARLSLNYLPVHLRAVPEQWEERYEAHYSRWYEIVVDYTGRSLTVQTDILPALSGLAAAFQKLLRDEYCAGLWRNNIIRGLCWNRIGPPKRTKDELEGKDCSLPSWSWASVVGGRIINRLEEENYWPLLDLKETAVLVDVCVKPKGADRLGQVSDACLIIRAPFCYIDDPRTRDTSNPLQINPVLNRRVQQDFSVSWTVQEFEQQHQAHSGQQFAVVRLMATSRTTISSLTGKEMYQNRAEILVLESTDIEQGHGPVRVNNCFWQWAKRDQFRPWRRIGCFAISPQVFPDDDDINLLCLEEMNKANWGWREVMIV